MKKPTRNKKPDVVFGANEVKIRKALLKDRNLGRREWMFLLMPLFAASAIFVALQVRGASFTKTWDTQAQFSGSDVTLNNVVNNNGTLELAQQGGAAPGAASVFISNSGADTNNCSQASPCKTLNRGYQVAQAGQVIEVAAGTYGSQTITGSKSGYVYFRPASSATVSLGGLITNADFIDIRDMSVGEWQITAANVNDVTLRNINVNGYLGFSANGTVRISMYGGSVGGGVDYHPQIAPAGGNGAGWATDILFDGVHFHDWTRTSSDVHTECLQVAGTTNFTVRNSKFTNCAVFDLSFTEYNGSGKVTNLLLENNFFDSAVSGGFYSVNLGQISGMTARFNSANQAMVVQSSSGTFNIYGNVISGGLLSGSSGGCYSATYNYNVTPGVKCGSTDVNAAAGFVNTGTSDLHLNSGAAGVNLIPASFCASNTCPSKDIDGQNRPASTNYDAGADEVGASAGSGTSYVPSGTATFNFDAGAGQTMNWTSYTMSPPVNGQPAGTSAVVESRTSDDNSTWSAWASDVTSAANSRYIQVRVTLATSNSAVTPTVGSLTLNYDSVAAASGTYYVDNTAGNDSNNGTSTGTPWKTISKVNSTSFQPGDTIYLKCGSTWTGASTGINLNSSGNSTSPITVDQYGSCSGSNRPILSGPNNNWGINADTNYVTYKNIEIKSYDVNGVLVAGGDNVIFDNIFINGMDSGFFNSPNSGQDSKNVQIINSRLVGKGSTGSEAAIDIENVQSTGWLIKNNDISNSANSCIIDQAGYNTFDGNTIHECGRNTGIDSHGIYVRGEETVMINNHIYNAAKNCLSPREGGLVENNRLHGCAIGIGWFDYTRKSSQTLNVRNNVVWDNSTAMYINYIEHTSNNTYNINPHTVNFNISNNTFIAGRASGSPTAKEGLNFVGGNGTGYSANIKFENNIVVGDMGGNQALAALNSGAGTYSGRNNIYYNTSGSTVVMYKGNSFSNPNSMTGGVETGSRAINPMITSSAASGPNEALLTGSPAIDAGVTNPATGSWVGGCTGALTSWCGSAPDIGAKESGFTGTPPDTTAPNISGVSSGSVTNTGATITWTTNEASDSQVEYGTTTSYGASTTLNTSMVTSHSVNLTGLTSGTLYHYRVKSKDAAGNPATGSDQTFTTSSVDTTDPTVPGTPTLGSRTGTSITINWAASSDASGVAGYNVYRGATKLNSSLVTSTTYADSGLNQYTDYTYQVEAVDAAPAANVSNKSTAATFKTLDTTAPSVPGVATLSARTGTSITLTWAASTDSGAGLASYRVYRGSTLIGSPTGTTFTDTGLAQYTDYVYQIEAVDSASPANTSAKSAGTTLKTLDTTAPTVPGTPTAGTITGSSIVINWTASTDTGGSGVAGYRIYRNGSSTPLASVGPSTLTYTDSGLTNGSGYSYKVAAFDNATPTANVSTQTSALSAMTLDTQAPNTPTNLNKGTVTTSSAVLNWTAPADNVAVTGYKVYRNGSATALTTINNGTTTTYTDSTLSPNTTYTYTVSAFDAANNESTKSGSLSVTTPALPDTTNPVVVFASPTPANGSTVSGSNVTLKATATDNVGVTSLSITVDGSTQGSGSSNGTYQTTWNTTTLGNGSHTIVATARDLQGNSGTVTITLVVNNVFVDSVAPSVPSNLEAGTTTTTSIAFEWDASTDNVGVAGYNIYRDGVFLTSISGSTSFNDTGLDPNTAYEYRVSAYDAANNESPQSSALSVPTLEVAVTPDPPTPTGKVGDLNSSGKVDIFDLSILLSRYGSSDGIADLNHTGKVDIFDLSIILSHWGS